MTNTYIVCLVTLLCCAGFTFAVPKECNKGPSVWCSSLKQGSTCGAVDHCTVTVWEKANYTVTPNPVCDQFVRFVRQLKDIKDLINEEYLATRIASECKGIQTPEIASICTDNTFGHQQYILRVLRSDVTPETFAVILNLCNNEKIDAALNTEARQPASSKSPKVDLHQSLVKAIDENAAHHVINDKGLLGASRCTWGPSYWCSNFSTGRECKATHHCVRRVWSKMVFPKDNDSICQICTDMVKQARDQLQSNETQEELKEVFEGSCQLIPIKVVAKECIRLADDFVPELVETLASEMNPQAVCSVAGLCNNAKIDRMLEEYNRQLSLRLECNNCHRAVTGLRAKFDRTSDDDFIIGLLQVCRRMSSLSDSCSMLVFKYYENIVAALRKELAPTTLCHASGQCDHIYHSHPDYTFPKLVTQRINDDVPCELCEQLVLHLRDVLVANTTEVEFAKILKGLCKQSGSFKDECLHLAEEYYPMIYKYLVQELKGDAVCAMIGVCGNSSRDPVIAPLLPTPMLDTIKAKNPELVNNQNKSQINLTIMPGPLPVERMFVKLPPVDGKAACSFCQYFLHYLQVEISDSNTEEEIIDTVDKACDRLPSSVTAECKQFVTQYGPAVIALLVQRIDPASVCPSLGICPQIGEVRRVEVNSEKSNCPLCLFAVEQLETMLKNNRSEEKIRHALDNLCSHLSAKLRPQCVDFVDTYAAQLVDMLVANMDAQEICVYLKLCRDEGQDPLHVTHGLVDKYHDKPQLRGDRNNFRKHSMLPKQATVPPAQDIETNEIFDNTVNGREVKSSYAGQKTVCVVCEFVLKEIDDQIKDKHNEDEIKKVVHNVCRRMPKSVRSDCDQFVEKYADMVISLLAHELEPQEVCEKLKLCDPARLDAVREDVLNCAVCETVVMAVQKVLSNDKVDRNIVHIVEKSCALLPAKYNDRCHTLMEIYGDSVIHLIEEYGSKGVCQKIGMCVTTEGGYVHMARRN